MVKFKDTIKYPDNKGNTMFETIVAFFILTIILALIFQMIAFCGQLRMKAADTSKAADSKSTTTTTTTTTSTASTANPAASTDNQGTGAAAGIALAGVALAGAAVVATKKKN